MMHSAIYVGKVIHQRFRPKRHRLEYRAFWLLADLAELADLDRRHRFFSLNRFNLFSLHVADHGDGQGGDLAAYVARELGKAGFDARGWRMALLTMPRVLGHGFNPLSVYFCRDETARLRAILYEVSNTFGERHSYLIPVEGDAALPIRQACDKQFYVSPFLDMAMHYAFAVQPPEARVAVGIEVSDAQGPMLVASLSGTREPLSDRALVGAFLAHPFLTLKVVLSIHWEALFIWLKRIGLRRRPPPPVEPVTVVQTAGILHDK
jgi:uncharacterized protein